MRKPMTIDQSQLENASNKQAEKSLGAASSAGGRLRSSTVIAGSREKWAVPVLKDGFDLNAEKGRAMQEARHYMNDILSNDDLVVELDEDDAGNTQGHVKDAQTGKVVNSYAGTDMLKLYSQNKKERGIIVDGRV